MYSNETLKQSWIELRCKSPWQKLFLLAFVLSVCVLKHTVKDSQPRYLAFWESKQSCPPPLNIDAVTMRPACWERVSKNVLIRDGLRLGNGSWRNDQSQKRQESKLSAEEWETLQMKEGTVMTGEKDLKFTRYNGKRKKDEKERRYPYLWIRCGMTFISETYNPM